jgi:exopolyphosphatase / guanosine-5'-triphosphate,3'-diphosphate pyrophosphatase
MGPHCREGALRVAVVDMGTNSTRLLVADVDGTRVREVERRSTVTRLGRGVDLSGNLSTDAIDEVAGVVRVTAIATSAVRDAGNADAFIAELRERFALDSRILSGDDEAQLTYQGSCCEGESSGGTLVIDIGGGSTEVIAGSGPVVISSCSLHCGTVRHTERYLRSDPPGASELEDLATDVRGLIDAELPVDERPEAQLGIGVAGTPTSLAAIDLQLVPYDPEAVQGHRLGLGSIQRMCSELSSMPLVARRRVPGLHPDRAPTVVAGVVILIQLMRAFDLAEIEVSEHDILYGAALEAAEAVLT